MQAVTNLSVLRGSRRFLEEISSLERLDLQLELPPSSWESLQEGLEGEELAK